MQTPSDDASAEGPVLHPGEEGFVVVIVHWNQAVACAATMRQFRDQNVPTELIVVDNGSRPDEIRSLRESCVEYGAHLREVGFNAGFGPGANVGLEAFIAEHEQSWCLLCPHDVELGERCLEDLEAALGSEPMAGLACADVGDGQRPVLDPYFGGITTAGGSEPGWEPADYPHGTLMALRRECLDEIGLFDELYFAYCEEADLGRRATEAGWKVGLVRGAMVRNVTVGTSVAVVDYLQQRNTLMLVRRMSGRYHVFIRMCISLLHIASGMVNRESAPPVFHPRARLWGMWDFVRGRTGPPPSWLYSA